MKEYLALNKSEYGYNAKSFAHLAVFSWVLFQYSGYILSALVVISSIIFFCLYSRYWDIPKFSDISMRFAFYLGYSMPTIITPMTFAFLIASPVYRNGIFSIYGVLGIGFLIYDIYESWKKRKGNLLLYHFPYTAILFLAIILPKFELDFQNKIGVVVVFGVFLLVKDIILSHGKKGVRDEAK